VEKEGCGCGWEYGWGRVWRLGREFVYLSVEIAPECLGGACCAPTLHGCPLQRPEHSRVLAKSGLFLLIPGLFYVNTGSLLRIY